MTDTNIRVGALPQPVAVIGLGYVGLSLALGLGRHVRTIGYDVSTARVEELRKGVDRNAEATPTELRETSTQFTADPNDLAAADVLIVAVPTPVDPAKRPDLSYLLSASRIVGAALAARRKRTAEPAIVVFESTVHPGCTEETCAPAIAAASGLKAGTDFKLGYSPERINPGDREHTLESTIKVVAGQDAPTLDTLARLYGSVVKAGVYQAPDIRTAEAAKVIENTQRDLNVALMNELAILFHKMGIDTREVLKAAGTKWNFLPFSPGLVGGHCIPEDPYYLTQKAQELGYEPQVILAGRRINDGMGVYVAQSTAKLLAVNGKRLQGARVAVLGVSFKENVKDTRNTRVVDVVRELRSFGIDAVVHDPVVGAERIRALGLGIAPAIDAQGAFPDGQFDAIVLAVPHRAFTQAPLSQLLGLLSHDEGAPVVVDVKGALPRRDVEAAGARYWSL